MRGTPTFVILAEGSLGNESAKTATGAIRYIGDRVAAVLDSRHAGRTAQDVLGFGGPIPVVARLDEALATTSRSAGGSRRGPADGARRGPADALLIGIAPQGGELPDAWRPALYAAIDAGLDLWSGLHTFLSDDPELRTRAESRGVRLVDLRRSPGRLPVGTGRARETDAYRVLTVGTDCNVGKMTSSLEIRRELLARGVRARFAGTGQTGILIDGSGIAVDAMVSDFVAGAAERLTLDAGRDADVVLVEGQGSLLHPGYSGVTLGLLHGSMPQAMILCWMPGRRHIYGGNYDWVDIPPLDEVVRIYEEAMRWVCPPAPGRVIGLAANSYNLPEDEARRRIEEASARTGLPATDPVRFGVGVLADAVIEAAGLRVGA